MPVPIQTMGAGHLGGSKTRGGFQSLWEAQRANNGLLIIEDIPANDVNAGEQLALALESFTIPNQSNNPIELGYLNNTIKLPGRAQVDDFEVVFRDFVDQDVTTILERWRAAVYNMAKLSPQGTRIAQGSIGYGAAIKCNATIYLIAPDGGYRRSILVEGMWPQVVSRGEINMETDDILRTSVTFSVDRVLPVFQTTGSTILPADRQPF